MTLIKSISGIRGTIGGECGKALTPIDIVKFIYAYCAQLKGKNKAKYKVVVGKDARISGEMVENIVCGTLVACGVDVIKAGFASTPTTEMGVILSKADGGVIITASHNPKHWNALKLLNEKGEFLSAMQGKQLLEIAKKEDFHFCDTEEIGSISEHDYTDEHIEAILSLKEVDVDAIKKAQFRVVFDPINSVGAIILPRLLDKLGVQWQAINATVNGNFAHNPEPLPENLKELSRQVVAQQAHLGISVDPDVDRLALICENGEAFGEEYSLVSIADYILSLASESGKYPKGKGLVTVSNLSSSRALKDITEEKYGGKYHSAAVGEVNVCEKMYQVSALIGGEGNGGIIFPPLHSGRDAVVGVALFLSHLAHSNIKMSELKQSYPEYHIAKNKIELLPEKSISNIDNILNELKNHYASSAKIDCVDGVKIEFDEQKEWVQLRRSNTEAIIRIYAEAKSKERSEKLSQEVIDFVTKICNVFF